MMTVVISPGLKNIVRLRVLDCLCQEHEVGISGG